MSSSLGSPERGQGVSVDQLIQLAGSLPHIDDEIHIVDKTPRPFGDKFHVRFREIKAVHEGVASEETVFYVRMFKERFGYDLIDFYKTNYELCETICTELDAMEPYEQLCNGYDQIRAQESDPLLPSGPAMSVNNAVNHPLGIDAIGHYYWNRINPMLEQAYGIIDAATLNAPFLTQ